MSGPRPPEVSLSAGQRTILERLGRRATSPQRLVRRVTIILAAAAGRNNDQIARRCGLAREMVQTWRHRWLVAAAQLAVAEAGGGTAAGWRLPAPSQGRSPGPGRLSGALARGAHLRLAGHLPAGARPLRAAGSRVPSPRDRRRYNRLIEAADSWIA